MSDHWEFFPCQMGKATAFVFYDHGISAEIDELSLQTFVKLKIPFMSPDERGLPTNAEFEPLRSLESEIERSVAAWSGVYVGRVTVQGARFFHFYADVNESDVDAFAHKLREMFGYNAMYLVRLDPEKDGYWRDLYPT